jgi:glutamate--cysteine ligase
MPTTDPQIAVSLDEARRRAGLSAFPLKPDVSCTRCVGLEPEFFPVTVDEHGRPTGRLPLFGCGPSVTGIVADVAVTDRRIRPGHESASGAREFDLEGGGRLTFEPGGQLEHSTSVHRSVSAALRDVDDVLERVDPGFRATGVRLAAAGLDIWNPIEAAPQQLPGPRYVAQAAYYDRRGPWGAVMMRHTASLQINLDLGPEGVWQERWRLANLLAPVLTAAFACSPRDGWVAARARAWQELDPTRSGFPRTFIDGSSDDPRAQWAEAALDADVMMIRTDVGAWRPGEPGFTLRRWIEEGHPEVGWPIATDVDYHLTTMFFEVRARGFLELRTGEALPGRWRAVPAVVASVLMYDDAARGHAIARLEGVRDRLPELWRTAARVGVRDPELEQLAGSLLEMTLHFASHLGDGWVERRDLETVRRYLERFVSRQRMPSDELVEAVESDPAASLDLASAV